ncbi:MAG TPA: NADH-quinone oxidoreductase subunit J [Myxococcota bacterium]|nr:NADH-quinone oxidoreductase subunit J [Myxococcota bacterium]
MRNALFWIFSVAAVAGAAGVVLNFKNPINSALNLVVSMLALAGLYIVLEAQFVGLIQVMVYAGAIVVLFLFVIMLLNLRGSGAPNAETHPWMKASGIVLVAISAWLLLALLGTGRAPWPDVDPSYGTTRAIGEALYSDYVLSVQVAGVLLLAGILAAVVLAKKRVD